MRAREAAPQAPRDLRISNSRWKQRPIGRSVNAKDGTLFTVALESGTSRAMSELVVVTGGAGFIGSHIAERLYARGFRVRIIDDFSTGNQNNLALHCSIEQIRGSVQDADLLGRAFRGAETVVHLAGKSSVREGYLQPEVVFENNVCGTFQVLSQAHRCGVKRILFASSSAIYGNQVELPIKENALGWPLSPYGWSKAIGESFCHWFRQAYGQEIVTIRCFNIFGPRQNAASGYAGVISRFLHSMLVGKSLPILGDGSQTRDFLYVADAAEAYVRAVTADLAANSVLNVGTGRSTSVLEFVALLAEVTERTPIVSFEPVESGEVRHSVADVSRSLAALGDYRLTTLKEGVRLTWEWMKYRRHQTSAAPSRASEPN
jgi:nucleoside-diphosphate-sugar epimerase